MGFEINSIVISGAKLKYAPVQLTNSFRFSKHLTELKYIARFYGDFQIYIICL